MNATALRAQLDADQFRIEWVYEAEDVIWEQFLELRMWPAGSPSEVMAMWAARQEQWEAVLLEEGAAFFEEPDSDAAWRRLSYALGE